MRIRTLRACACLLPLIFPASCTVGVDVEHCDRGGAGEIERTQVQGADAGVRVCAIVDAQVRRIEDDAPGRERLRDGLQRAKGVGNGLLGAGGRKGSNVLGSILGGLFGGRK